MVGRIKASTIKTKKKDLEFINGLMDESMRGSGKMESNMVKPSI